MPITTRLKDLFSQAGTLVVVLCTVLLTVIVVRREFFAKPTLAIRQPTPPVQIDNWAQISGTGHRIGPADSKVTMVVFSDFECPACANFATNLFPGLQRKFPGQVSLVFRHWPLSNHRFAYPTARAAECAASQGRFSEFHDVVFTRQKELGLKTYSQFGAYAGVKDTATFNACVGDTVSVAAIDTDIKKVAELGGTGTPTIIVNGWLFRGGVTAEMLDSAATAILKGS